MAIDRDLDRAAKHCWDVSWCLTSVSTIWRRLCPDRPELVICGISMNLVVPAVCRRSIVVSSYPTRIGLKLWSAVFKNLRQLR